jgi:hypothetical protein
VRSDWRFYGKSYGWALAFKKSGKALVALFPGTGSFTAQLILKEEQLAAVPRDATTPALTAAIERAKPYQEGRWIFLPVETERDLGLVERLVEIRAG